MPRLSLILATAALAVVLAVVAVQVLGEDPPGSNRPEPAAPLITGRTPAFHLSLLPEQRRKLARQCLDGLTSAQAKVLGGVKDDLALLADDPMVVGMILEDFAQRAAISKFEISGFGDMFALVKNPEFAEMGLQLQKHEEFSVRHKAIAIAATQHDPRYVAGLDALFAEIEASNPGEGMRTLELILHAARVCGGDDFPRLLARGLRCEIPQVRAVAAAMIREDRMERLAPRLEPLLEDKMSQPRLQSAWGVASFGRKEGEAILLKEFDPRQPAEAAFILEAARDLAMKAAIPVFKARLDDADLELRSGMLLALAFLGDQETVANLRRWAFASDASVPDHIVGLMAVAALGSPDDDEKLCAVLKDGDMLEAQNVATGLSFRKGPPSSSLVRTLIGGGHFRHTSMLSAWLPRLDDTILPWLSARIDEAESVDERLFYIGCLGLIGSQAARDTILAHWKTEPRLVEQRIRLLDLAARKGTLREG